MGGEKVCQLKCACLNDCNNSTGDCNDDPEVNCDKCDENNDCNDGESCDGDFCVPSGVCTERKNQVSDVQLDLFFSCQFCYLKLDTTRVLRRLTHQYHLFESPLIHSFAIMLTFS